MSNLRSFLKSKNASSPITYGYDFKELHMLDLHVPRGYQSGGAGFVLSYESFKRLSSTILTAKGVTGYCASRGFGDIDLARCLRKLDV
jgi:hypothetical protein